MSRKRMLYLVLLALCPLLAGGWSLDYPTPYSYVPKTNADGTGNAAVNETFTYRILEPKADEKDPDVVDGEVSSSTSTGGWYEYTPGR